MKTSSPGVSDLFLVRWMYSSIVQLENNDWKRESVLISGCQQNQDRIGLRIGLDRTGIFAFGAKELFWEKLWHR